MLTSIQLKKRNVLIRASLVCCIMWIIFYFIAEPADIIENNQSLMKDNNITALMLNIIDENNKKSFNTIEKINEISKAVASVLKAVKRWSSFNFTAFEWKNKLVHYFYCSSSSVEQVEWRGHFSENYNASFKEFIPSKFEESPIGFAPTTPTSFLIEEIEFCSKRPQIKAVAIVPTAIKNIENRIITRLTWGRTSEELGVVFFVGIAKNEEEKEILSRESEMYHDIIQGNYADLYQFLVYKNLNAFYWLTKNCQNIKWVVHADDDCIFNVKKYVNFINNFDYTNPIKPIFCSLQCDSKPIRHHCKCNVSEQMYPYSNYPIYCSGYLWFTLFENIISLMKEAPNVKFLWIDDVYVTGLLAEKANVSRYGIHLGGDVESNKIDETFGWMSSGKDRVDNWKKVEAFYL